MLKLLVTAVTVISLTSFTAGTLNNTSEDQFSTTRLVRNKDSQCPLWTYYDTTIEQCRCYYNVHVTIGPWYIVACNEGKTSITYMYCMTYDDESDTLSISYCPYFNLQGHNISEVMPGMIDLPDNISELNDYMCGPMNRKGILCSECIDGYGPSVTSKTFFQCSPCSGVWYGAPLYLFLELVPVTVFYIIVLLLQLNLTVAPMTGFIFICNYISVWTIVNTIIANGDQSYLIVIDLFYGIWTLDFIRYVVPPFCVSPNLRIIHAYYLQYASTFFPYVLIAITWILIHLHSRNCKTVVWIWKKSNGVIRKHINVKRNSSGTVVNAFATFFLLTFAKLSFTLLLPFVPGTLTQVNIANVSVIRKINTFTDVSVDYVSGANLASAVVSLGIFLFAVLPPVVLIAFYPSKTFRQLVFKCCSQHLTCTVNIFVEKFHSCYKDGLDGGKDLRSFASLYFLVTMSFFILQSTSFSLIPLSIFLGSCSLLVAIVQPHKKQHMSVIESLLLANGALLSALSDYTYLSSFQTLSKISTTLPGLGLVIFIGFKLLKKPSLKVYPMIAEKMAILNCCTKSQEGNGQQDVENIEAEIQLPDRVVHPELYEQQQETDNTAY